MENICWNCKHNTLKLKILVPPDQTIKEHVHQTGNMQANIIALIKEEPERYTVWYRIGDAVKLMTFRMLHVCKLKVDPTEKAACSCHAKKQEINRISNIIYHKVPLPAEAELIH
ncbi:MAG: hypothetical protein NWE93_05725 [Candidatus Bathyarchaeota archaeon]|nr:hypothetical protein [Candidatus Bathyarchaeota archaeon]